jgi:hypothetical protein
MVLKTFKAGEFFTTTLGLLFANLTAKFADLRPEFADLTRGTLAFNYKLL